MALNKYMHPKNIYKTPPDFAELSKKFSEFSNIAKVDVTGKVTIDFKNPRSLRILTKCLLKSDFDLDVEIPEDRLVPTLPLRLNYLLWIEDLMDAINRKTDLQGLDIGTGACAIYPLLAAVKNNWHMVGTETDEESQHKAVENIKRNNLQELIRVQRNTTTTIFQHMFEEEGDKKYDFCMCNPPFYSSIQELCESRSTARPPPKNGFTGSPQELITDGGELEFCRKMIRESQQYKDRVLIFTTMVGHKFNLKELLQDLKAEGIKYTNTEFCQGRVTRWGVAWTYQDYDIYNLVPPRDKPRKKIAPVAYLLPELPNNEYTAENVYKKVKSLLDGLQITYKILNKRGSSISLDLIAISNTWCNQRRKRRLLNKKQDSKRLKTDNGIDNLLDVNKASVETGDSPNASTDCVDSNSFSSNNNMCDVTKISHESEPIVHAFMRIFQKEAQVFLETEFIDGSSGKEGLHQIVQFIKNNWK